MTNHTLSHKKASPAGSFFFALIYPDATESLVMEGVMHYAFSHYPAADGNYGLVLWGHGSGWLMDNEVKRVNSRAFGVDKGEDGRALWMNIPTMANILKGMPHLKFIMADCCNFMCLEVLYELRNVTDYIIGSPAEIPDEGAPYDEIVPDMFADGRFYTSIIDKYYKSVNGYLPLTAVQSSQMEQLAQATHQAIQAVQSNHNGDYTDMTGLIHYYHTDDDSDFHPEVQRLHGDRREDARCVDVRRAESCQGKLRQI